VKNNKTEIAGKKAFASLCSIIFQEESSSRPPKGHRKQIKVGHSQDAVASKVVSTQHQLSERRKENY